MQDKEEKSDNRASGRLITVIAVAAVAILVCAAAFAVMNGGSPSQEERDTADEPEAVGGDIEIPEDINTEADGYGFTVTYESGTDGCWDVSVSEGRYTLTFGNILEDSEYSLTGVLNGNIVVDAGDEYELTLSLRGLTINSDSAAAVTVLSADKVTISAKNGTNNYINDTRAEVTDESDYAACVYSASDMDIQGKGGLYITSENNNGIHSKDDLSIKNLTLYVNCEDNALKGNDSVTAESGSIVLISRTGDGIKTTNSEYVYNDDGSLKRQKGSVTIGSEEGALEMTIYAARDGIDAVSDVVIYETESDETVLNIYTDRFSSYSEETAAKTSGKLYICAQSNAYEYSVLFTDTNSNTVWKNASYTGAQSGRYIYSLEMPDGFGYITIYAYSEEQEQGQSSDYTACSVSKVINTYFDTVNVTISGSEIDIEWTSSSSVPGEKEQQPVMPDEEQKGPQIPGGKDVPGMGGQDVPGKQDMSDVPDMPDMSDIPDMPEIPGMQDTDPKYGDGSQFPGGSFPGDSFPWDDSSDDIGYSAKGIKSDGSVYVKSGTVTINSYDDSIHSNSETGGVYITGGILTLYSGDDGIHAENETFVGDGKLTIRGSYEGLEGLNVTIAGGDISIISSDDGVNGTAVSGTAISISGGRLYVNAGGDGLDSNSRTSYSGIVFSGGRSVIFSSGMADSAIDTETGYGYSGGYVLAASCSGMMSQENTYCKNFSSVGTSTSINLSSGSYITVKIGNDTAAVAKIPSDIRASAVFLGSSEASIQSSSSGSPEGADENGVWWGL